MNTIKKRDHIDMIQRSALAVAIMVATGSASAMEIDVGNPDIRLRWDNTARYNLDRKSVV